MILFTFELSLLTGILFLVLLTSYISKWEKTKIVLSCIVPVLSLISMILFCYIQKAHGNPDAGKEFVQWYFPLSIYLFLTVFGIMSFIITIYKKVKAKQK